MINKPTVKDILAIYRAGGEVHLDEYNFLHRDCDKSIWDTCPNCMYSYKVSDRNECSFDKAVKFSLEEYTNFKQTYPEYFV